MEWGPVEGDGVIGGMEWGLGVAAGLVGSGV